MRSLELLTTSIIYETEHKSIKTSFFEYIEKVCFLGGDVAHILPELTKDGQEEYYLSKTELSYKDKFLKILVCFLLIPALIMARSLYKSNSLTTGRVGKISLSSLLIPTLLLITKYFLRSTHTFKQINPQERLEEGLNIPDQAIKEVQDLLFFILKKRTNDKIQWLSRNNNLIFKLVAYPQFVFKIGPFEYNRPPDQEAIKKGANSRFSNMIKAKEVCMIHRLGSLVIPHAKTISVKDKDSKEYAFIVEESLDFEPTQSRQRELYHQYSKDMNEPLRQLAVLIAHTSFNDVTPRNIPKMNTVPTCIALIDLEHMKSASMGFIGDYRNKSCGLIRCLANEEQIDLIIEEGKKLEIFKYDDDVKLANTVKEQRLKEIKSYEKLCLFYKQKNITGKEPLNIDINTLGLDLTRTGMFKKHTKLREITLKQATEEIITIINTKINEKPDNESRQYKRYVELGQSDYASNLYRRIQMKDEEKEDENWLQEILTAVMNKGYVFSMEDLSTDYCVQF